MTESRFSRGVLCGIVFTMMVGAGGTHFIGVARDRKEGLLRDSLEAMRDTTRTLQLAKGILEEGNEALQRRSIQTAQRADSLDRALVLERRAKLTVSGRVDTVTVAAAVMPVRAIGDSGTRVDSFAVRQEPYSVAGVIVRPPAPAPDTVRLNVALDSVSIEFRLHCGARASTGVRPASLTAVAPAWLHLKIDRVEQDPGVCNPPASPARAWLSSWTTLAGLRDRLGAFVVVTPGGSVVPAAGVRVWP